jgi:aminoglycoside phosphotransferase (APT) family kinase protein
MSARALYRADNKERLLQRAAKFLNRGFVAEQIIPLVPEVFHESNDPTWLSSIVRAKGTGRITLRYDFSNNSTIYAKAYTDALGLHSYMALRRLWADGFGKSSTLRVPEPLGFIPDEKFLLMRRAEGIPFAQLLLSETPRVDICKAARAAARWLAQLHSSELPFEYVEPACERIKIFKLSDMMAKAAAAYPEQSSLLLELLQKIRSLAPRESETVLTPTHGQYTPANVFLHGDQASVIDLDRICLSDPAKDVAMFVHRVRSLLFKDKDADNTTIADLIVQEFLGEYRKLVPQYLRNLAYYRALFALKGFAKIAKDRGPNDPMRRPLEFFYLSTLEGCFGSQRNPSEAAHVSGGFSVRGGTKEELGTWACSFKETDFLSKFVYPVVSAKASDAANGFECKTSVVQNTGTGRLTLRYDFESGHTLYAKLYTDDLGAHSYSVMKELWDGGFNGTSPFQVPEPLAFLTEHNFVLMRGVSGTPLAAALNTDGSMDLIEGCRQAARWLAAFHKSSIRIGEPEADWDSLKIFRICARLIKAAAARSDEREALLDYMHILKARIREFPDRGPVSQTHGRFHHEHVFINNGQVAVIDLDRSRPTNPAKDVAEFLRVLRMTTFRSGQDMSRADDATSAFLDEYLSEVPEVATYLPYYWSAFLWLSLFGVLKKLGPDDPRRAQLTDFHTNEIERAMRIKP